MSGPIRLEYTVPGDDFARAGEASADLKATLKKLGVPAAAVRRISIALYEGEINLAIHAGGGRIDVAIGDDDVQMVLSDQGPGIPDVEQAMLAVEKPSCMALPISAIPGPTSLEISTIFSGLISTVSCPPMLWMIRFSSAS